MYQKIKYRISLVNLILLFLSAVITASAQEVNVNITNYPSGTTLKLFVGQILDAKVVPNTANLVCENPQVCTARKKTEPGEWTIETAATLTGSSISTRLKAVSIAATDAAALVDTAASPAVISNGVNGAIPVEVYKLPDATDIRELKFNETQKLSELLKLDAELIASALNILFTPQIRRDGNDFSGIRQGAATLTLTPKIGSFSREKKYTFSILPAPRQLRILDNGRVFKGAVNDTILGLRATVEDGAGTPLTEQLKRIKWGVRDPKDNDKVNLRQLDDGTVEVDLLESSAKPVYLVARLEASDGEQEISDQVAIFIRGAQNIIGFDTIEMRLNLMDERTAKDLFGGVATDDYMIAKLRVFNKVPEDKNGGPSSSILFFSEGLEVNVSLQKRLQERRKGEREKWEDFDQDDVEYVNNWVYVPRTDDLLIQHFITKEIICSARIKELTTPKCEISTFELDRLWYFYEKNQCVLPDPKPLYKYNMASAERCANLPKKNWIPFRPYAFMVIAGTHERRSERSTRERILKGANALAGLASFATAFARPANNSGLVFGLDKYSNLLIPSFEKLFPSRREVQRKNILDMALQPIEEVPFGKEVNKVVFIPKQAIEGVLPGYDVRIATISVSKIKAEASVLNKEKIENR